MKKIIAAAVLLALGSSATHAMPGTLCIDSSPTVPEIGGVFDLRSEFARPAVPIRVGISPLLGAKCVP